MFLEIHFAKQIYARDTFSDAHLKFTIQVNVVIRDISIVVDAK